MALVFVIDGNKRQLISDNGVSRVWREGDWVYKRQPKFLTDNEIWCLQTMLLSGYVPLAEQVEPDVIRTKYIENCPVTDREAFMRHYEPVLAVLAEAGIRHGDLTIYALRVKDNKPYLIDFAESRLECDPRPDKRAGGDRYWLGKTMVELCQGI